ncbi:MAG: N-acetylmuramoyl-L-alanine amidase [Spirochaetes bacterium]|nr:N-acetylmuramoyl-L-alanine amidase [Spirochaetota bacterium]
MIKMIKHGALITLIGLCVQSVMGEVDAIRKVEVVKWESLKYVSLYDLTNVLKIDNTFDVVTQRGKLYRKSSVGIFQIGYSFVLVNGQVISGEYPVIRKNGEVFLPLNIAIKLAQNLFPELKVFCDNDAVFFEREIKPKEDRDSIKTKEELQKNTEKIAFIVIDPGHGGKDPGAIGFGIMEKNITIGVSRYLFDFLKKRMKDMSIKLTRKGDIFVELSKRTEMANRLLKNGKNGIFISIHVNASLSPKIAGFETYYLSPNPTNEEARTTATIENNVIVMESNHSHKKYDDIEYIEALMLNSQIQKESILLANYVQKYLAKTVAESDSRGVKKADFYVLRGSLMPAVLVEIGYISNKSEAKMLQKNEYRKKIAEGIGRGIVQFINDYNNSKMGFSIDLSD